MISPKDQATIPMKDKNPFPSCGFIFPGIGPLVLSEKLMDGHLTFPFGRSLKLCRPKIWKGKGEAVRYSLIGRRSFPRKVYFLFFFPLLVYFLFKREVGESKKENKRPCVGPEASVRLGHKISLPQAKSCVQPSGRQRAERPSARPRYIL